ncbi:hypothetical protein LX64_00430 [Chitinophaga skermanii]|uniref:Uncharacterized protein n=1 Tax=Chitinophaga skermanii TaxID=331697 RepID=A0A327R5F3_9BACT|nr:hypothetical protein [Chitinophaga skermanii]RAJ10823.1 hypothetical protein LX64_00430 [Chitinophaga skermanii]
MPWNKIIIGGLALLTILFGVDACRERRHASRILAENQRLLNENRDLRKSVSLTSETAQQIVDRHEVQATQPKFVEQRAYYRKNWRQFISINSNDYRTGLFGGIKNLKITVGNQTDYQLDNVVVEVQYLRSNGDQFKTESYTLRNVQPRSNGAIEAAGSRKGMKVKIRFVSITSQNMDFCWSVNKKVPPNTDDPYQCSNL